MKLKLDHVVADDYGVYKIAANDLMAVARKRKDGWWDQRTKQGRAAVERFLANQRRRAVEYRGGVL